MAEIFAGADALTRAKSDCPSGPSSEIFAVADTGSKLAGLAIIGAVDLKEAREQVWANQDMTVVR